MIHTSTDSKQRRGCGMGRRAGYPGTVVAVAVLLLLAAAGVRAQSSGIPTAAVTFMKKVSEPCSETGWMGMGVTLADW